MIDEVEKVTKHNDSFGDELTHSIVLLRERRGALITAAVTGQLPEVLA